jgi:hypothetical protein
MALTKQTARKSTGGKPPPPRRIHGERAGGWVVISNKLWEGIEVASTLRPETLRKLSDQRPCASYRCTRVPKK